MKLADDTAAIAKRLAEIEKERLEAIMGAPIEPVEPPKIGQQEIDWSNYVGMFSVDAPD